MKHKVLLVIDSLNSGGAQRQLIYLAQGLLSEGYETHLFVYRPEFKFFLNDVISSGIIFHSIESKGGFSFDILSKLYSLHKEYKFNSVISFLEAPNFYCEILNIIFLCKINLIVSERNYHADPRNRYNYLKNWFHLFAHKIVTNTHTQANWLKRHIWLTNKVNVIYNGYPLKSIGSSICSESNGNLKFLIIGRIDSGKNGLMLLQALLYYYQLYRKLPSISWVGRFDTFGDSLCTKNEMDKIINSNEILTKNWNWLGERVDIDKLIINHDAVIHISLYEGLPNAICEAMLLARPVIASNISDNSYLISNGYNGFLCDPKSQISICKVLNQFESLSASDRQKMGMNALEFARKNLNIQKMLDKYLELL